MQMTDLDQQILYYIIQSNGPISGKTVAYLCDVSVNTVRKEIKFINDQISKCGCFIDAQASVGYSINITDEKKGKEYIEETITNWRRSSYLNIVTMSRVYEIVRRLLVASEYLTPEKLSFEMYCSPSTMLRELDQVKEYLQQYHIELKNKRGYGFYLAQNEWLRRLCILDQRKVFAHLTEEKQQREQKFMYQTHSMHKERRKLIEVIQKVIENTDYAAPHLYLVKLAGYIILNRTRKNESVGFKFTKQQIEKAKNSHIFELARKIYDALPAEYAVSAGEMEILSLTMLMICAQTIRSRNDVPEAEEYEKHMADAVEFTRHISQKYPCGYMFSQKNLEQFACFFYHIHCCVFFDVIMEDCERLSAVIQYGLSSADYCGELRRFYLKKYHINLPEYEILTAFYILNESSIEHNSRKKQLKMVVASISGIERARNIGKNIYKTYTDYEIESTEAEFCELKKIDWSKYELLVIDDIPSNYHLPDAVPSTVMVDVFRERRITGLDCYFRKYVQKECETLLTPEHFRHTSLKSKQEVFGYLADMFSDEENRASFIESIEENDKSLNMERANKIVFITCARNSSSKAEIAVLFNKITFVWNYNKIRIFIYYSYGKPDGSLHASQALTIINHIRERLLRIQPESLVEFNNGTYDQLMSIF